MVAIVDHEKKEIVFLEPPIGGRARLKVTRALHPICLEDIDEFDFKFLCALPNKKLNIGEGKLNYKLHYDPQARTVHFEINGNLKRTYNNFGSSTHYDTIASETQRLWEELCGYRNNGKLYFAIAEILKEAL